jgi:tRNA pseudouridine38-40 synthase
MAHYKVILSYDGTNFLGFQRQSDVRTVQGEVENALNKIGWQGRNILAAGRTDSGVHASGQVIAFDLNWDHTNRDLQRALNANLPIDIAVSSAEVVRDNFHPRFDACVRHYQYQIYCREDRQPLRDRYSWKVWPDLNIDLLEAGSYHLTGTHDFAAFGTPHHSGGSTIRTIKSAVWRRDGYELAFDIQGNAFLYRMVRRIVHLMVKIGQGKVDPDKISDLLQPGIKTPVQGLAPSCGLNLVRVIYSSQ